jgi:undecaprenyl-phosphate galactose phosphotransferase/putative colanic acid biosynthesis UDP-glucose lipid carrier transferase
MLKVLRPPLAILFWNLDFCTIVVAYYVTWTIAFGETSTFFLFLSDHYLLSFWINIVSWIYFSHYFQLYASRRLFIFRVELLDVVKAAGIPVALAAIPPLFSTSVVDIADFFIRLFVLQATGLVLLRSLTRTFLKYMHSRGYNYRQVLIVGRNDRAARLARRIEQFPELGARIVGFIDSPNGESHRNGDYPFHVLGNLEDCERILRENIVDEVFLTLPIKSFYAEIEQLIGLCETVGIEVKIPTDIFRSRSSKATISHYLDLTVINLYTIPKMTVQSSLKRIIDMILMKG